MRNFLFLLTLSLISLNVKGQLLTFVNYNTSNGLPSNYIFQITEDSNGFLWFATDGGAVRFDGSRFERILDSTLVYRICENQKGIIWFCTFENGAIAIDSKTLKTTRKIMPCSANSVFDIREDNYGRVLLRTFYGVEIYSLKDTILFKDSINQTPNNLLIPINSYQYIFRSNGKLYSINSNQNNIDILPFKTDLTIKNFIQPSSNLYFLGDSLNNDKWFLTYFGLSKVEKRREQLTLVDLLKIPEATSFCHWNNNLVVGTKNNGLKLIKGETEITLSTTNGLKNNYITSVFTDNLGQLWVGTFGGGILNITENLVKPIDGITSSVQVVNINRKGQIFAGTEDGLFIFTPQRQIIPNNEPDFHRNVRSIAFGKNDELYVGTFLALIGPTTASDYASSKNIFFHGNGVSGIVPEENGKVYFSTYGSGIWEADINKKTTTIYDNYPTKMVNRLFCTGNTIWGTSDKGLFKIENGHTEIYSTNRGLPDSNPSTVFLDSDSSIWVGNSRGISLFNKSQNLFTNYTTGFKGNKVIKIFRDNDNRFWVLSNTHLHLFKNRELIPINSIPILLSNDYILNDATFDKIKNELVMATSNGLQLLNFSQVHRFMAKPRLYISKFLADTTNLNVNDSTIVLEPDQKNITIEIGIHYLYSNKTVTWVYFLEGIDRNWSAPSSNFTLNYPKLPYGKFKLLAKAINPDGVEGDIHCLLNIDVKRPFLLQWYSLLSESAIILLIIIYAVKYFSQRKLKRKMHNLEIQQRINEERQRIARDLHDNVGSQLTYLITNLDQLSNDGNEKAHELSSFGRTAINQLRETIWAIRSDYTDVEDFIERIRKFCYLYLKSNNIEYSIELHGDKNLRFTPVQTLNLYRIVQEAITNIIKHSKANNVNIRICIKDTFSIEIIDDGIGLSNSNRNGYGLKNMSARANEIGATINVENNINHGTRIYIALSIFKKDE